VKGNIRGGNNGSPVLQLDRKGAPYGKQVIPREKTSWSFNFISMICCSYPCTVVKLMQKLNLENVNFSLLLKDVDRRRQNQQKSKTQFGLISNIGEFLNYNKFMVFTYKRSPCIE
jgi:hypothetical protein